MIAFKRHRDEYVIIRATAYDGALPTRARQSLSGVVDLACTIYRKDDMSVVVAADHAGCTIDETSSVNAGDFTYRRAPDGLLVADTYLLDFRGTIGGLPNISLVEQDYVQLVIS